MNIACTGFVSEQAGSVASANALLLRALLDRGHSVTFFSKPSFVDPRPAVGDRERFRFFPVVNSLQDAFRKSMERVPGIGFLAGQWDANSYNQLLVRAIRGRHRVAGFDVILWLGDFARGTVSGVPTVSFVQGAPGSDARSLIKYRDEVRALNGAIFAWRLALLARLRLSPAGLPPFRHSDGMIVGSPFSESILHTRYGIASSRTCSVPYPIDLDLFSPCKSTPHAGLRVLWLGRMVPRKRLPLFLDGIRIARQSGYDIQATVVGRSAGLGEYEKLLQDPVAESWLCAMPVVERQNVPDLMAKHDVLAQPSEEENFGSSVAEAQACGMPVIVGQSNGNAHYVCERDIVLADDRPESFARALIEMSGRKGSNTWGSPDHSRHFAVRTFGLNTVTDQLEAALQYWIKAPASAMLTTASKSRHR